VQRKDVRLPWHLELPMGSLGRQQVPLTLNATASAPMSAIDAASRSTASR
jgi:hypothetical protein